MLDSISQLNLKVPSIQDMRSSNQADLQPNLLFLQPNQCPKNLMNLLFDFLGCLCCPSTICVGVPFMDMESAGFSATTVFPLLPPSLFAALASRTLCDLLKAAPVLGLFLVAASRGLNGRSIVIVNVRKALRFPREGNWSCKSKSAGNRSARGRRAGGGAIERCLDLALF
jgi:hypothetical protein